MNEKKARFNHIEMVWTEAGAGDALLMVHGFPLSREMWQPQVAYFAKSYRVIAPDLRGFGQTSGTPEQVNTMELLADDLVALLDYCDVKKAVVMGLSMGGYISFALYRKYPERLKALILADTKSEGDSPEAKKARYLLADEVRQRGSEAATDGMLPKLFAPLNYENCSELVYQLGAIIDHTDPATIAATLPGLAERFDNTAFLPQIAIPTLVIHGESDLLMPAAKAEIMAEQIPGAQFSVVPQAGHMSNMENPLFFNNVVEKFLTSRQ